MSHEYENGEPQELKAVEQALAAMAPAPPRVDRDQLMFLAGAASVSPEPRVQGSGFRVQRGMVWPATSAALAATSLALAIMLVSRPAPPERIVYRDREVPVAGPQEARLTEPHVALPPQALASRPTARIPADNYLRSREVALRLGLDALGSSPGGSTGGDSPAPTYRSFLDSFLPARQDVSSPPTESSQM
jgi:hypothetical protein